MTRHRASRAQRPMIDISPAATPESMPCCNSISTPTPAAESSAISRAAMTNIHATGFSSDVTLRPLPTSACCTAFSGTRVIRATKPLSPVSVTSSCVAGSAYHNSLWLLWDVVQKIAVAGHQCAERRTARFKFCRGSGIHHTALIQHHNPAG
ncbi:hypothetical protein ECO1752_27920 (plasmid) [Escherichia coli]|nr:hypothetical protein ECO1752_27920 [Escherichia coli]